MRVARGNAPSRQVWPDRRSPPKAYPPTRRVALRSNVAKAVSLEACAKRPREAEAACGKFVRGTLSQRASASPPLAYHKSDRRSPRPQRRCAEDEPQRGEIEGKPRRPKVERTSGNAAKWAQTAAQAAAVGYPPNEVSRRRRALRAVRVSPRPQLKAEVRPTDNGLRSSSASQDAVTRPV